MSADANSVAGRGYSPRKAIDDSIFYDCNLCNVSSVNLDAARAHHAVHVAGPDLLDAAKELLALRRTSSKAKTPADLKDLILRTRDAGDKLAAAVAKAEPKG